MRGERGDITNDGQGTPGALREAVWIVALRPEFGPYVGGWSRTAVKAAPILLAIAFVTGLVIAALVDAYGLDGRRLVLIVYSTLVGSAILLCARRATVVIRRWKALSTPEGVREHIERRRIRPEDHARERAAGAVRSIWGAIAGARWENVDKAAAAFELASPRTIVIDPMMRFRALPTRIEHSFREPEEINTAPAGDGLRSRIRSMTTFAVVATVLIVVIPSLIGVGSRSSAGALVFGGVMVALWFYEVYRPVRSSWWAFGSAGESVIAAPSLVVVRSPRRTRVFTPRDSVLVVWSHPRITKEMRVVIARSQRERVALRFAGPNDERLLALWTMWNHPRASRWDDAAEQVVPEPGLSGPSDFLVENAGNGG